MKPINQSYLAVDQGGHASRASLYDAYGTLLNSASVPIRTQYPAPEYVEHDPEEVVTSVQTAIAEVLHGTAFSSTVAVGLATQRSSVVCWDRLSGAALSPILSWQDRRTTEWLRPLQGHSMDILHRTGLPLSPHYGAGKLRWCLDHLPDVKKARKANRLACGPLASFLAYRLTEERTLSADPANASRTLLWNLDNSDWDPELAEFFGVPIEALPPCVGTRHAWGHIMVDKRRIPLTVVTGDQSAALFVEGEAGTDSVMINLGTGAFLQQALPYRPPPSRLLTSIAYQDRASRVYALEGTVNGAGSALAWISSQIGMKEIAITRQLPGWLSEITSPPLFLNGISGLGTPYLTPLFASRFIGDGSPAEKCVAVIESIVFLLQANLEEMARTIGPARRIVISGGLSRLDGLCQRIANLSGLSLLRPSDHEATVRGLMRLIIGAAGAGFEEPQEVSFLPGPDPNLGGRYQYWRKELDAALTKPV